jgi:hypothetical protein
MTATHLYHIWNDKLGHICAGENKARLRTFAWMLVGMMMSQSVHLSHIARKIPSVGQQTSIVKRLSRLLQNRALRVREWYRPVACELLCDAVASGQTVRLIIDGTKVGGGHRLLMVALAYRRRSLPIAWTWVKGTRGHSLASTQCALFAYIRKLLPVGASVLVVGDSEFGAVELMRHFNQWGWAYVLRQKGRIGLTTQESAAWQRLDTLVQQPGQAVWLREILLTHRFAFPVNFLAYWQPGEKSPWLLATNLPAQRQTLVAYRRRMWIEIVCTQMTKRVLRAFGTGWHYVSNLNRLVRHHDPVNQQFDQLSLLGKGCLG